jgi:hypothetical protein
MEESEFTVETVRNLIDKLLVILATTLAITFAKKMRDELDACDVSDDVSLSESRKYNIVFVILIEINYELFGIWKCYLYCSS